MPADIDALLSELRALKARLAHVEGELLAINERGGAGDDAAATTPPPPPAPTPPPPIPLPPPPDVPIASTRVVSCHIVRPADCDAQGVCVGGHVLSWIDICAGLSAKTLARGPCVTVSVDAVSFLRPCTLGCVVIVAARVNRTFASSMEVGVRVEAEDPRTGERAHCCSAYLTFVSMRARGGAGAVAAAAPADDSAKSGGGGAGSEGGVVVVLAPRPPAPPAPLPTVVPTTGETRREWLQAAERRAARLRERERARRDPQLAAALAECRLRPVTHREGFPTLPPVLTAPCSLVEHFASGGGGGFDDGHRGGSSGGGGGGSSGGGVAAPPLPRSQPHDHEDDDDDDAELTHPSGIAPEVDVLAQQLRGSAVAASAAARTSAAAGGAMLSPRSPLSPYSPLARTRVSPASTTSYATHSILPQYANTLGVTFGGQVMAWIEQCAFISAARLRGARRAGGGGNGGGNNGAGAGLLQQRSSSAGGTGAGAGASTHPPTPTAPPPALRFLTAGMDSVAFKASTVVGDVMYLTAQVSAAFGSSLEVAVSVFAESPREGRVFHCADAYVTVVVVDSRGKPVPIPFELAPETAAERMRYEGALARRKERLEMRRALVEKSRHSLEMPLGGGEEEGAAGAVAGA
jgi:acyl-CoA thioesterase 11